MAALAKVTEQPLLSPDNSSSPAIDVEHLSRMTLGERSLERESAALFDRQAEMLLPRIRLGKSALAAASVHTLKGSAVGIGAFKVASAAEAVEQAEDAAIASPSIRSPWSSKRPRPRSPACCG